MTTHEICNTCETVKHCAQHGCIPITSSTGAVEQPGATYAAMPKEATKAFIKDAPDDLYPEIEMATEHPVYTADQMRALADATCALRAARAGAQAVPSGELCKLLADARHRIANLSRAAVPFNDPLDGPVLRRLDAALAASPTRAAGAQAVPSKPQPASAPVEEIPRRVDEDAVDCFAQAMKKKLTAARKKGRGGWQNCSQDDLSRMLREHVEKGDPLDVANFCMFLWSLGYGIPAPAAVSAPACAQAAPELRSQWLNPEDMAALERLDETFSDGEGYDLPKSQMVRLADLGVVRHHSAGRYSITSFGRWVLGSQVLRKPLETAEECNARLGEEHRARLAAEHPAQATPHEGGN